ncbi:MAG: hypothetical protein ACR2GR_01380 [Rhodothermales bacterium]
MPFYPAMLAQLRTYRFLPALLVSVLLSGIGVPLVQEVCAMQMQAQPMPEQSVMKHETPEHAHQATSQVNPVHAADRCPCKDKGEHEGETQQPPCHAPSGSSFEASCCETTPAGTETWALPPIAPKAPEVALVVLAAATDVHAGSGAALRQLPLWPALVDPPPSPPVRLLFSVFLI